MSLKRNAYTTALIAILVLLILHTETAVSGAIDGVELCLKSVIPSLFPFMFLCSLIGTSIGNDSGVLAPLRKLCNMPSGCENILLLGILGGYPIGAKLINQQYEAGKISKESGHRLMGFCNNPGPAFIFGMLWDIFQNKYALWALWGVQIISSVMVGIILPRQETTEKVQIQNSSQNMVKVLSNCVKTMANICAWIVIFRVIISYFQRFLFPFIPDVLQVTFAGLLEMTNGYHLLTQIRSIPLRFILCSGILSFGGVCVTLQTATAASKLGLGWYLPGKILQTLLSLLLSTILQSILFSDPISPITPAILTFITLGIIYFAIIRKNSSNSLKFAI